MYLALPLVVGLLALTRVLQPQCSADTCSCERQECVDDQCVCGEQFHGDTCQYPVRTGSVWGGGYVRALDGRRFSLSEAAAASQFVAIRKSFETMTMTVTVSTKAQPCEGQCIDSVSVLVSTPNGDSVVTVSATSVLVDCEIHEPATSLYNGSSTGVRVDVAGGVFFESLDACGQDDGEACSAGRLTLSAAAGNREAFQAMSIVLVSIAGSSGSHNFYAVFTDYTESDSLAGIKGFLADAAFTVSGYSIDDDVDCTSRPSSCKTPCDKIGRQLTVLSTGDCLSNATEKDTAEAACEQWAACDGDLALFSQCVEQHCWLRSTPNSSLQFLSDVVAFEDRARAYSCICSQPHARLDHITGECSACKAGWTDTKQAPCSESCETENPPFDDTDAPPTFAPTRAPPTTAPRTSGPGCQPFELAPSCSLCQSWVNCSAHGVCRIDGTCSCHTGWNGVDCSRQTKLAAVWGDPHMRTFYNRKFDFMGQFEETYDAVTLPNGLHVSTTFYDCFPMWTSPVVACTKSFKLWRPTPTGVASLEIVYRNGSLADILVNCTEFPGTMPFSGVHIRSYDPVPAQQSVWWIDVDDEATGERLLSIRVECAHWTASTPLVVMMHFQFLWYGEDLVGLGAGGYLVDGSFDATDVATWPNTSLCANGSDCWNCPAQVTPQPGSGDTPAPAFIANRREAWLLQQVDNATRDTCPNATAADACCEKLKSCSNGDESFKACFIEECAANPNNSAGTACLDVVKATQAFEDQAEPLSCFCPVPTQEADPVTGVCNRCKPNYYTSGGQTCGVFCTARGNCSSSGECSDEGACVCVSGSFGVNCELGRREETVEDSDDDWSKSAIAGVTVGTVTGIALVVVIVYIITSRGTPNTEKTQPDEID